MKITAGVYLINNEGKLLIAHPTGHDFWSIPKGKPREDENYWDAAVRETWEETNIKLENIKVFYELPEVKYKHGKKKLISFLIFEGDNRDFSTEGIELKCNSIIGEGNLNAALPEMDDFKWVDPEEAKSILHYTQVKHLDTIIEIIESNNGEAKQ